MERDVTDGDNEDPTSPWKNLGHGFATHCEYRDRL